MKCILMQNGSSSEGNATPSEVLTGKTFSNSDGEQTGVMPNNGAVSKTLGFGESYTVPEGYHSGNGKVSAKSPSGTKSITANGTVDVTDYASANVNVVGSHSCTTLSLGTVDVSKYNYIIFSHGGWGTDNGTGGSTTFKVSGDYSYSRTISHGNNCDRSTCGGHYTTVIDNTSKKYKTLTFAYSVSGDCIWGGYSIHGII